MYRGDAAVQRDPLKLALYISFFPQLVAGPIVRATMFLPQLERPRRWSDVNVRMASVLFITGFMEAGETPEEGIRREIQEETNLETHALELIGVYDFQRMNQVIIAYHAVASGEVRLSPELAEYRLYDLADVKCWPAGTGYALAKWLRSRGHEPQFVELPARR